MWEGTQVRGRQRSRNFGRDRPMQWGQNGGLAVSLRLTANAKEESNFNLSHSSLIWVSHSNTKEFSSGALCLKS